MKNRTKRVSKKRARHASVTAHPRRRRTKGRFDNVVKPAVTKAAKSPKKETAAPQAKDRPPETDILVTMANEIDEAVELMRPHFPDSDDASLRRRAEGLRWLRYQDGCWPDFAEIAKQEAIEAACAAEAEKWEAIEVAGTVSNTDVADPEVSAESDVRLVIDNKAPVVDGTNEQK